MNKMKATLFFIAVVWGASLLAQDCNDQTHSANIHDSWVSCERTENPNAIRGDSHWVLYDLGYVYSLGSTHFWNYNVFGSTENGMKEIAIDLSINGTDWTEAGIIELGEAPGSPTYEGETGIDLGETEVRYVLLTALDTWGGSCAGLSEVRFDIEGTVSINEMQDAPYTVEVFPNPSMQHIFIQTDWKVREIIITNTTGQEVFRGSFTSPLDISMLPEGIYFITLIDPHFNSITKKIIKQGI